MTYVGVTRADIELPSVSPVAQRSAHALSLRRRTGCGGLRDDAPSIAATLLETLHGAG